MALKIVKGNLLMMVVRMSSFMSLQMHNLMSFELHKWGQNAIPPSEDPSQAALQRSISKSEALDAEF